MMITKEECFKQLRSVIDATLSTVDEKGNPQSRIIDIMHIEDETLGENVIAEVLQKGYKIGDTVIRPAMVKVAN